jgi:lauroyl/myristoyl acyltransferase
MEPPAAASPAPLVAPADIYRIPALLATKVLYTVPPASLLLRLATLRGALDSVQLRHRRAQVIASLRRHLSEEDQRQLRSITRRYFEFRARGRLARIWPMIRGFAGAEQIEVDGLAHLDEALAAGRGAILVSAHFGHGRLIKPVLRMHGRRVLLVGMIPHGRNVPDFPGVRLSRLGERVSEALGLPRWSRFDAAWRETVGEDLPAALNLRPHVAALARNDVLVMLADGRSARRLVRAPVLGMDVHFAPGAMSIARATGAPVLPTFVVDDAERRGGIGIRLVIHPPLDLQTTSDSKRDLDVNIRRFAAVYEQQVRTHPHNWHWLWVRDGAFDDPK